MKMRQNKVSGSWKTKTQLYKPKLDKEMYINCERQKLGILNQNETKQIQVIMKNQNSALQTKKKSNNPNTSWKTKTRQTKTRHY